LLGHRASATKLYQDGWPRSIFQVDAATNYRSRQIPDILDRTAPARPKKKFSNWKILT
jgi:hypothetical protein